MTKICFISPEVPPYLSGGAGVATLNFSKVLVKRGHDASTCLRAAQQNKDSACVTIIARKLAGGENFETISGVKVYRLNCTKIRFLQLSHLIFTVRALILALKIKADLYYSQTVISPGVISALLHLIGKKTIVHLRGVDLNKGFSFFRKPITNFVLRNNDLVFVLSKEHQDMLKIRGFNSHYITNGVDVDFDMTKKECRKRLGWRGKHIVYAGRLDKTKGVIYAVKSVENMEATLHIIGEESGGRKEATDELKKYVAEHQMKNVIFHGVVDREELFKYIKGADVFLHPLLEAWGMGNAVLEAMHLETPVIGSDVGYFKELIEENCGILVEKANYVALNEAINKLLGDEKLAKKLADNAYKYVKENHNWDKIAERFEGVVGKKWT